MLRILGSKKRTCDGLTRRDLLYATGLGAAGLAARHLLPGLPASRAAPAGAASSFGKAKSCILLYLYGAATQLETFDVKPQAPVEVRGELGTIPTSVPGFHIGELLPRTARILDRATVVRSMTHPYPLHAVAYSVTSNPAIDVPMQMNPRDPRHWPFIGSVVDYLAQQREGSELPPLPRNIGVPWRLSARRAYAAGDNAGPYAAFLGAQHDPVWTDFVGEGTRVSTYTFGKDTIQCRDPYGPLAPGCRFELSPEANLPQGVTLDRLDRRRSLLTQFDDARRVLGAKDPAQGFDHFQDLAFSLLASDAMRSALDIEREPPELRERYGATLFGQATLAARRLVERGARFVTVFWDEFGLVNSAWDTHFYHYELLKEQLCPGFDRAYSSLLVDLEQRGLLDETVVACITEHGRTPKLENVPGAGRGHWARAYSSIFAGGGIARGKVVGRTDAIASEVVDTPISPKDILATLYHLLGIDPETVIHDRLGRPVRLAGEGHVRGELLA